MPVDSTKAMPSSTSRSKTRGRPVRPCTAGGCGRINGSNSTHSPSLISRGGGKDTSEDSLGRLRRTLRAEQSSTTYFCNVLLVRVVAGLVVLAVVAAPVLPVLAHGPVRLLITMLLLSFSMASAHRALLPVARRPRRVQRRPAARVLAAGRAVLLVNPGAGRGTAAGLGVAELTRRLGVDVVQVRPGDDLSALAEAAVRDGAGVLGVAGGDGSMAAVAAVTARYGVPFVCVPAGTRNHFALDLGLDRTDLVHAMTAFECAVPYRVDLAEVNGRVFVNNVSLGIYAAMVSSRHYRRSKLRAVLDELPDLIGPESEPAPLRFQAPDGTAYAGVHALLVSNNPYRLGSLGQAAWRPRLDAALLGVLAVRIDDGRAAVRLALHEVVGRGQRSPEYSRWTASTLTVQADGPVTAGIDGEPAILESPLRFTTRPGALIVHLPAAPRRGPARRLIEESRQLVRTAVEGDHRGCAPAANAAPTYTTPAVAGLLDHLPPQTSHLVLNREGWEAGIRMPGTSMLTCEERVRRRGLEPRSTWRVMQKPPAGIPRPASAQVR